MYCRSEHDDVYKQIVAEYNEILATRRRQHLRRRKGLDCTEPKENYTDAELEDMIE